MIMMVVMHVVFPFLIEHKNSEQDYFVSCLRTILLKYITQGRPVAVSLPAIVHGTMRTTSETDNLHLVNSVLRNINMETLWTLHVYRPDNEILSTEIIPYKPHSYIIFIRPETEERLLLDHFESLLKTLETSFNPRARFIFVVTEYSSEITQFLCNIIEIVWMLSKAENFIIVIPNSNASRNGIDEDVNEPPETKSFDIYSWFPYEGGSCGVQFQAVLMDRCCIEDVGKLSRNINLFPNKIPNSFAGCLMTVLIENKEPYAMGINIDTDLYGDSAFRFRGLEIEYLLHVAEVLNLTVEFVTAMEDSLASENLRVQMVSLPLSTELLKHGDATVPYLFTPWKWYVPCPRSAPGTEGIVGVFESSVWFIMLSVLLLTALAFWRSAVAGESNSFRNAVHCVYSVWCVFMGVSVPEMPRTWRLRFVFLLFVCYSLVISTIFQSFFISFLVTPRHLKPISTFEDLIASGLRYGNNSKFHHALGVFKYEGIQRLNLDKMECLDNHKCLEHLFIQGGIAVVSPLIEAQYVASCIGMRYESVGCSLNENIYSLNSVMYLEKRHPVVNRFNVVIRRCMEAGLVEKHWSEFNFNLQLRNAGKSKDLLCKVCRDMYFAFSLSDLKVAFFVLGLGHALSVTVFIAEIFCSGAHVHRTRRIGGRSCACCFVVRS